MLLALKAYRPVHGATRGCLHPLSLQDLVMKCAITLLCKKAVLVILCSVLCMSVLMTQLSE